MTRKMDTLKKSDHFSVFCIYNHLIVIRRERGEDMANLEGRRNRGEAFTEQQIKQLKDNPNVLNVTEKTVSYTPEFKLAAIKAYKEGKTPMEIFIDAGFNPDIIHRRTPVESLKRWRAIFASSGESGLTEDRRGSGSTGRNPTKELTTEDKLRRAEARIKLLEAENDFLKKLEALERQVKKKH
jgi:transposase